MKTEDEIVYRKWIGLCQLSKTAPLTMNMVEKLVIKHKDETLGEFSRQEFSDKTVYEIMEELGIEAKEQIEY